MKTGTVHDYEARHPIVSGLAALMAVALAVGIVVSLAALATTKVLGLGSTSSASGAADGASMYLPEPGSASEAGGPAFTLDPGETSSAPGEAAESEGAQTEAADTPISLTAAQQSVGSFGRIDLSGAYPSGNGAILRVERREGGRWVDFGVTIGLNGDSFDTYIQTSRAGRNVFRVVDSDTAARSNTVAVTVG